MPDPLVSLIVAAALGAFGLLLFWPDHGLYWRWRCAREMTGRVLTEDTLKFLYESEVNGRRPSVHSIAGALSITVDRVMDLLPRMEARGLLKMEQERFHLTPQGRDSALHIIRAHRLWERYLADETGFAEDEWHEQAHRREHLLSREEVDALSTRLGNPTHDPHGDPIPSSDGTIVPHGGRPLTTIEIDQPARIVHLEDEPPVVYAQLVAEELHPGMQLWVIEISPQRVRFWANGDEHVLAPIVATNIMVTPLPQPQEAAEPRSTQRLTDLKPGEKAQVVGISRASRGTDRRRLMDLGILPGTRIEAEMFSPGGDPTAYRVRGALIALREEQAKFVHITREEEVT